ncbi:helix-turn-helix domain-containing protein [Clostridium botulinum]|uniref:helix-turn-helix domain-containing protein n=1 Tax=Clostridium botulinum TaxID=1491 RepID=UPI0019685E14|nr:helix-turn-helix transcriptional regulator [Clostridium botulinum]MBN1048740.1 XRE family transcriptional regulator [Clostridium botulinum]
MEIYQRIKHLRKTVLNLSQEDFAKHIGLSRSNVGNIEVGRINVTDRVIGDICDTFNINENWLRNGIDPMRMEPDTFSLDEYVKQKGATDFELEIIKAFFEMDPEIRKAATEQFKASLLSKLANNNELAATKEESFEDYKKKELEAYALELEAESKGEISSASEKLKDA